MAGKSVVIVGLSTSLGISIIGNGLLLLDSGATAPVKIASGSIEVTGASKAPLAAAITKSGASGTVECRRGVISNAIDKIYCSDNDSAGFLLDAQTDADLIAETDAKLDGLVSDAVDMQVDQDGKIYLTSKGVIDVVEPK